MLNDVEECSKEMDEIKAKLSTIHRDIKNLMENTNQQYIDLILANSKKDFINVLKGYMGQDIQTGLDKGMIDKCETKEECRQIFQAFLLKNAGLINHDKITEELMSENRAELNKIMDNARYENCEICFEEINILFEKQLNLMRSMCIYSAPEEKKQDICAICEESIVKDVLEPLSNKQRLQILKSMASETKTFSALSEITGLKGGNLLFHIQKLLDGHLIIQRHERGDYMLTDKGYKLLVVLSEIYVILGEK
ncbi:MAG TPA: winged helix-turn-helix domain-containing protein [Methanobacterium sp.]|nr:winged helix-turn-helix domain-containing protein [Methanobacterium sp.]